MWKIGNLVNLFMLKGNYEKEHEIIIMFQKIITMIHWNMYHSKYSQKSWSCYCRRLILSWTLSKCVLMLRFILINSCNSWIPLQICGINSDWSWIASHEHPRPRWLGQHHLRHLSHHPVDLSHIATHHVLDGYLTSSLFFQRSGIIWARDLFRAINRLHTY